MDEAINQAQNLAAQANQHAVQPALAWITANLHQVNVHAVQPAAAWVQTNAHQLAGKLPPEVQQRLGIASATSFGALPLIFGINVGYILIAVISLLLIPLSVSSVERLTRFVPARLDPVGTFHDFARAASFSKASARMAVMNFRKRRSGYYLFEAAADRKADKPMLVFEGKNWSWRDVQQESNKLARYWQDEGFKRGDTVALVMPNKPQFVILWISFMAIGVTPAFINYNLTGDALKHCIKISNAERVVFDAEYEDHVNEVDLGQIEKYSWTDDFSGKKEGKKGEDKIKRISKKVYADKDDRRLPDKLRRDIVWKDPICFIYTSGTSGLPKAAPCSQAKFVTAGVAWANYSDFKSDDVIYSALPLYHSSAAFLGFGAALSGGTTMAISRKFSASKFWDEARTNRATAIQYIGEIARYLVNQKESPNDKKHSVRIAYGNGMPPDLWMDFKKRFNVPIIQEFYAATESPTFLFNRHEGFGTFGSGCIGRESPLGRLAVGNVLVKVDPDSQEIVRDDKTGFCKKTAYGEPGELFVRMDDLGGLVPAKSFHGYKGNKEATSKKVAQDVFRKGDAYFRTGDLLSVSFAGYYKFQDRLGDTYRWKGENVATTEVQQAVNKYDGIELSAVYGVKLPKHDGRAGCVALDKKTLEHIDINGLAKHLKKELPKYAVPLFVRALEKTETTSTHKIVTTNYKKQGVDPAEVGDDTLYILDGEKYREFKEDDWKAIESGEKKL